MIVRVAVSLILVATCAAIVLEASPRLPRPTGPWAVGTTIVSFESVGSAPSPLLARLWYPASRVDGERKAPYLFGSRGLSFRDRVVGAFVRTEAFVGAPLGNGRFPVIIYVPGFGGRFHHNSALAQELASHGYVVVAIDDTESSKGFDYSSAAGARASFVEGNRKTRAQTHDVLKLIDRLHDRDAAPADVLSHRLALDRIGVLGFSFGGAVAAEAAATDDRVRAAVDLDGSIYATALAEGVPKPFLFASAKGDVDDSEGPLAAEFDRENLAAIRRGFHEHGGYLLEIEGMKHFNFTDTPILPSLRHTGVGSIDGREGAKIIGRYVLAFFNRYLKGDAESLLDARGGPDDLAVLTRFTPIDRRGAAASGISIRR